MSEEELEARKLVAMKKRGKTLKDLTNKLKAIKIESNDESKQDEEEISEVNPIFCSDICQNHFENKVQKLVDQTNVSSMYLFGGTQTPFYRLKKAANILKHYSKT